MGFRMEVWMPRRAIVKTPDAAAAPPPLRRCRRGAAATAPTPGRRRDCGDALKFPYLTTN